MATLFRDAVRRVGPTAFLLSLCGTAAYLYDTIDPQTNLAGYVETAEHQLVPQSEGAIVEVFVRKGDPVAIGDPVARIEDPALDAEISIAKKQLDRIDAAIAVVRVEFDSANVDRSRSLSRDVEAARAALVAEQAKLAEAEAEIKAVNKELDELEEATRSGFGDANALRDLKLSKARLGEASDSSSRTIKVLESNLAAAKTRESTGTPASLAVAIAPLQRQFEELQGRLEAARAQHERLTLRAPITGEISDVHLRIGETAGPHSPVATLIDPEHRQLVVCVPERTQRQLEAGMWIAFRPRYNSTKTQYGEVTYVAPRVEVLPPRCQPGGPSQTMGRLALVNPELGAELQLGGTYTIAPEKEGARHEPKIAAVAIQDAPPTPNQSAHDVVEPPIAASRTVEIPNALSSRTRLEISGAVWSPEANAFLVVSDDTGLSDVNERVPWVFRADIDGTISPEPVDVLGVDEIDDLEAIARTPAGQILLATSHGRNWRGRRRPSRQRVLKTRWDGTALRVEAEFSLRELVSELSKKERKALGTKRGEFELEGMDVYEDALYFGLKSPRGKNGAHVWRLADYDEAFDAKTSSSGSLTLFTDLDLTVVDLHGRRIPAGVSALRFAEDGRLFVAATPAAERVEDDVGSIYVVEHDGGLRQLWHTVDGKPEALALTPDESTLVVGFDTDIDAPRWMTVDLSGETP